MNCDPLAHWYRWLEYGGCGRALERRRFAFLDDLSGARKVLMLGEGDGRFLAAFLRINTRAEVDCVDNSGQMLGLAQRRAGTVKGAVRVRFHHANVLEWLRATPSIGYDLVCTHFFLDCFFSVEVEVLAGEIARHASASACWVVSEFRYAPSGWKALVARAYITLLYQFFAIVTGLRPRRLPDYHTALRLAGFRLEHEQTATLGMLVSERWVRADMPVSEVK